MKNLDEWTELTDGTFMPRPTMIPENEGYAKDAKPAVGMNWPNEIVEKVAKAVAVEETGEPDDEEIYYDNAQAALSSITLQDIAKLPEVKAALDALQYYDDPRYFGGHSAVAAKALAPFTEVSNG